MESSNFHFCYLIFGIFPLFHALKFVLKLKFPTLQETMLNTIARLNQTHALSQSDTHKIIVTDCRHCIKPLRRRVGMAVSGQPIVNTNGCKYDQLNLLL